MLIRLTSAIWWELIALVKTHDWVQPYSERLWGYLLCLANGALFCRAPSGCQGLALTCTTGGQSFGSVISGPATTITVA
jgi:hypothetical protein